MGDIETAFGDFLDAFEVGLFLGGPAPVGDDEGGVEGWRGDEGGDFGGADDFFFGTGDAEEFELTEVEAMGVPVDPVDGAGVEAGVNGDAEVGEGFGGAREVDFGDWFAGEFGVEFFGVGGGDGAGEFFGVEGSEEERFVAATWLEGGFRAIFGVADIDIGPVAFVAGVGALDRPVFGIAVGVIFAGGGDGEMGEGEGVFEFERGEVGIGDGWATVATFAEGDIPLGLFGVIHEDADGGSALPTLVRVPLMGHGVGAAGRPGGHLHPGGGFGEHFGFCLALGGIDGEF